MNRGRVRDLTIAIGPLVGEYGGVAQHVKNTIKYSKYKLTPITPSPLSLYYSESRFKGYIRAGLKRLGFDDFDIYGLFLSEVRLPRFDIVHLHGHPYWPAVYLKPRHRRAKYIHTVHQIYLEEDCYTSAEWKAKQRLNQLIFESCRNSDAVISVARWQEELLGKEAINSVHIPNGVDIKACESADPARFREKYKISEDFYIFPGDIRKYKRPELFVGLAKRLPDQLFVMIGNAITKVNLTKQLNACIPNNVVCLGALPPQDALDAFAASKVFVLASKNDTFPTALLEGMGCKRAVVAANNAGPKEIVTDGVDGFLFCPDNKDDLYEKVLTAWDHSEVGFQAYKTVKTRYDWPVVLKRIDDLYVELYEGKVPRGDLKQ